MTKKATTRQAAQRKAATPEPAAEPVPLPIDPLARRARAAARCVAVRTSNPHIVEVYVTRKVDTIDFALRGFAEIVGLDLGAILAAHAAEIAARGTDMLTEEEKQAAHVHAAAEFMSEMTRTLGETLQDPERRARALARCDAYLCVSITHIGLARSGDVPVGILPESFDPTALPVFAPLRFVPADEPSDTAQRTLSVAALDEEERILLGLLAQQAFNPASRVGLLYALTTRAG